jgi:hypothetical protein
MLMLQRLTIKPGEAEKGCATGKATGNGPAGQTRLDHNRERYSRPGGRKAHRGALPPQSDMSNRRTKR